MKTEMIEDALLKIGFSAGLAGFRYIVDAIETMDKDNKGSVKIHKIYQDIAKMRYTSASGVERAIRYSLEKVRANEENRDIVRHYIGFANQDNRSSLGQLLLMLRRDEAKNGMRESRR